MSKSKFDFSIKFFRPPQRTVSCHNGLLNTRTKHIMAKDRLNVAEQRILDIERRKFATNIQLLTFEQRQLAKRLSSRFRSDQSSKIRQRSISDASDRRAIPWHNPFKIKSDEDVHNSKSNLLSLPISHDFQRRFSSYSNEDTSENHLLTGEIGSGGEEEEQDDEFKPIGKKTISLPLITVIPPEEDALFFIP